MLFKPLVSVGGRLALTAIRATKGIAHKGSSQPALQALGRAVRSLHSGGAPKFGTASLLGTAASAASARRAFGAGAAQLQQQRRGIVTKMAGGGGGGGPSVIDQVTFREMGLLSWLIIDLAINWLGWAVSAALQTDKFYDMLGTGSFLTLGLGSMAAARVLPPRKVVVGCMVAAWALRLGGFLVYRVHRVGHDSRFDEAKKQPLKYWVFWTMQAAWVFITLSPVLLLNTASAGGPARIVWSDVVGVAMFALGLGIEAVADAQKFAFKMDPANKGRFIDAGLWRYARYPNYFGEMTLWWGVFITCTAGLSGAQFASAASPLFVMALLFFVSGIPLQEEQAKRRWGDTPEYQEYRQRTNLLAPVPKWLLPWGGQCCRKSQ